ncbi:hypothetical protein G6F70_008030 [Rhizopus microsporus]|nr:hypothetical protein G6F71_008017 [Rhizopus microsporus]KAG1195703.1 hypothetical protein G6F70_008030 [Rhizopus microsporus]
MVKGFFQQHHRLSRKHIFDGSDASSGSPFTLLDNDLRESIASDTNEPELEEKHLEINRKSFKEREDGLASCCCLLEQATFR